MMRRTIGAEFASSWVLVLVLLLLLSSTADAFTPPMMSSGTSSIGGSSSSRISSKMRPARKFSTSSSLNAVEVRSSENNKQEQGDYYEDNNRLNFRTSHHQDLAEQSLPKKEEPVKKSSSHHSSSYTHAETPFYYFATKTTTTTATITNEETATKMTTTTTPVTETKVQEEAHLHSSGNDRSSSSSSSSSSNSAAAVKTSKNFANLFDETEEADVVVPPPTVAASPPAVPPPTQAFIQDDDDDKNSHITLSAQDVQSFLEPMSKQVQYVGQGFSSWIKKQVMAPNNMAQVQSVPIGSVAASGITVVAWILATTSWEHHAPLDALSWALAGGCSASLLSTTSGPVGTFLRAVGTVSSEAALLLQERLQANDDKAKNPLREVSLALEGVKESAMSWLNEQQQQQEDHGSYKLGLLSYQETNKVNGEETLSSVAEEAPVVASSSSDSDSAEATARVLMAAATAPEEHEERRRRPVIKTLVEFDQTVMDFIGDNNMKKQQQQEEDVSVWDRVNESVLGPMAQLESERVADSVIVGAGLSTALASMACTGNNVPVSCILGLAASYASLTTGPVGQVLRATGGLAYEASGFMAELTQRVSHKLSQGEGVDTTLVRRKEYEFTEDDFDLIVAGKEDVVFSSQKPSSVSEVSAGAAAAESSLPEVSRASTKVDDLPVSVSATEAINKEVSTLAEEETEEKLPIVSKNFAFGPAPVVPSDDPVVKTMTTAVESEDTAPVSMSTTTTEPDREFSSVKVVEEPVVEETVAVAPTTPTETEPTKPETEVVVGKEDVLPMAADLGEPVVTYYDEYAVRPKAKKSTSTTEQAENAPLDHNKSSEPMNAPSTTVTQAAVSQPKSDLSKPSTSSPRKSVTAAFDATCASCLKSARTTSFQPCGKPDDIGHTQDDDIDVEDSTISQNIPMPTAHKDVTSAYASTVASTMKNARLEKRSVKSNTPVAFESPDAPLVAKETRTFVDTTMAVPSVDDSAEMIVVESNQNESSADEKAQTFVMGPGHEDEVPPPVASEPKERNSVTAAFAATSAASLKSAVKNSVKPSDDKANVVATQQRDMATAKQDVPKRSVTAAFDASVASALKSARPEKISAKSTTTTPKAVASESQDKPPVSQETPTFVETANPPSVDVVPHVETTNFHFSDPNISSADGKTRTFVVGKAQHDDGQPAFVPGKDMISESTTPHSATAAVAASTAAALKNEKMQRKDKQRIMMPVSMTAAVAASTAAALKSEKLQRKGVQKSAAPRSVTAAFASSTAAVLKNKMPQRNDKQKSATPLSVTAAVAASTAASLKNEKLQRNGVRKSTTSMSVTAAVAASTAAALKSEKVQRNGKQQRSKPVSIPSNGDALKVKKPISSMTWLDADQLQEHIESTFEPENDSTQAGRANSGPKSMAETDASSRKPKSTSHAFDKQPSKTTLSWEDELCRAERAYKETKATQDLISRLNKLQSEKELKFRQEREQQAPKPVLAGLERKTKASSSADSTMMLELPREKRTIKKARQSRRRSKKGLKMERDGAGNDNNKNDSKFLYRLTRKEGPPPTTSSLSTDFSYLSMEGTSDDYLAAPPPLLRRPRRLRRRRRKQGAPEEQPKGTVDAKGEETATKQGQPELEQKQSSTVDKEPKDEDTAKSAMSLEQATAVSEFLKGERRRLADHGLSPEDTKLKVEQAVRLLVFLVLCQAGQQDVSMENKTSLSLVEKLFIAYNSHRPAPHPPRSCDD